jgi:hypothetical protein
MNNLSIIKLVGTNITSIAEFRDSAKAKVTPTNVLLKYKNPLGVLGTATVTQNLDLTFTGIVLLDVAGDWNFRWECSGSYATAEEFSIQVLPSNI